MIFVFNKRHYDDEGEYIGRPSVLGNPYSHLSNTIAKYKVNSREEAIEKYDIWLTSELVKNNAVSEEFNRLVKRYKEEGCLILVCHCAPYACHGDVIRDKIRNQIEEN